jgi:hypothetical protein
MGTKIRYPIHVWLVSQWRCSMSRSSSSDALGCPVHDLQRRPFVHREPVCRFVAAAAGWQRVPDLEKR